MSPHWILLQLFNMTLSVLEMISSPAGGLDIGRSLLQQVGLRRRNGKRK